MSKNIIIGLVLAVIWASSLALFGKHQYDMGVQITESAWNKKENDELKAANAEIVKLRDALDNYHILDTGIWHMTPAGAYAPAGYHTVFSFSANLRWRLRSIRTSVLTAY